MLFKLYRKVGASTLRRIENLLLAQVQDLPDVIHQFTITPGSFDVSFQNTAETAIPMEESPTWSQISELENILLLLRFARLVKEDNIADRVDVRWGYMDGDQMVIRTYTLEDYLVWLESFPQKAWPGRLARRHLQDVIFRLR